MFTGIVTDDRHACARRTPPSGGLELTIASAVPGPELGESVAVDGACLTVAAHGGRRLQRRTWSRTIARPDPVRRPRRRQPGQPRAGPAGSATGSAGTWSRATWTGSATVAPGRGQRTDARLLDLEAPPEVARVSVPLGSITVDGVSLTVNAMPASGTIQISLIPFTLEHTTLADRRPGDRVHLEADTIGKYVQALLRREE